LLPTVNAILEDVALICVELPVDELATVTLLCHAADESQISTFKPSPFTPGYFAITI